jgi:hypothetical protein
MMVSVYCIKVQLRWCTYLRTALTMVHQQLSMLQAAVGILQPVYSCVFNDLAQMSATERVRHASSSRLSERVINLQSARWLSKCVTLRRWLYLFVLNCSSMCITVTYTANVFLYHCGRDTTAVYVCIVAVHKRITTSATELISTRHVLALLSV